MTAGSTGEYTPLEALNPNAEDHGDEAGEEQSHGKRTKVWQRVDATSFLAILLGFPVLLLAVTLLALFWHESVEAINRAEPNIYWARVVHAGWATRLVTVCTASIRAVMAFQAGLVTALVAGIALETTGAPLLHAPLYSMLRAVKAAPSNFWTATDFRPHLPRLLYVLVLIEVLVTAASQFLSTIFLSDFVDGTFTQRSNSTNVNILNATYGAADAWWSMPPAASWTFAELPGSFEDQPNFQDTGHTFRAFLPFEEEMQRTRLHRSVVQCRSWIIEYYVHLSGQIPTENLRYPLSIDQVSQPYINFTCILPVPAYWDNNTVGETSLCVPHTLSNWTVLNEDPLIQPAGFVEASNIFMVLDVLSTSAIIDTLGHTPAVQTIRTDGPWTIVSNGSAYIETLRISACLSNLAMQTLTVGMNSTTDNFEPTTAWDHVTQSYNTELSRLQLGVLSSENMSPVNKRGTLTLDPRSEWETFNPPADTLGIDPTTFFLVVIVSLPTLFISNLNFSYDPSVILSRRTTGFILGNSHPTHVDLFQDTLITTASPALAVQALLTRIYQMAYYKKLAQLNSPVAAVTAFSSTATIPAQWTGFVLGLMLIVIHSTIVVVVIGWFVRLTEISFIGSYWQTVAHVVSEETRPILEEAGRTDDRAVRVWAKREAVVESLRCRWILRRSFSGRVTLGPVNDGR
ncbi:hypothetical protein UA08_04467 [Talaromyces atroroseus]|uniref:Transmembrane protein n=1 Tax=Talaromyces atroroseus TaxID=1441469 RepID=A0A225B2I6_TALAT|nr:hypothetical protein UA08_04467 [Talaromyces atroroseus]OKL60067.1 hypothetical protein UA08_04467 [Talaromyces atroroseus]